MVGKVSLLVITVAAIIATLGCGDLPLIGSENAAAAGNGAAPTETAPPPTATTRPTATPRPTPNVRATLDVLEATLPAVRHTPTPAPTAAPRLAVAFRSSITRNGNHIFIIDTSESFRDDLDRVKTDLKTIAEHEDFPSISIQLMTFATITDIQMDFRSMGDDAGAKAFSDAVDSIQPGDSSGGRTSYAYAAIEQSHDALNHFSRDVTKPNIIVIFTDGAASDVDRADEVFQTVLRSKVPNLRIDVVGYDVGNVWVCDWGAIGTEIDLDSISNSGVLEGKAAQDININSVDSDKLMQLYRYTPKQFFDRYCVPMMDYMIDLTLITDGEYREVSRQGG